MREREEKERRRRKEEMEAWQREVAVEMVREEEETLGYEAGSAEEMPRQHLALLEELEREKREKAEALERAAAAEAARAHMVEERERLAREVEAYRRKDQRAAAELMRDDNCQEINERDGEVEAGKVELQVRRESRGAEEKRTEVSRREVEMGSDVGNNVGVEIARAPTERRVQLACAQVPSERASINFVSGLKGGDDDAGEALSALSVQDLDSRQFLQRNDSVPAASIDTTISAADLVSHDVDRDGQVPPDIRGVQGVGDPADALSHVQDTISTLFSFGYNAVRSFVPIDDRDESVSNSDVLESGQRYVF